MFRYLFLALVFLLSVAFAEATGMEKPPAPSLEVLIQLFLVLWPALSSALSVTLTQYVKLVLKLDESGIKWTNGLFNALLSGVLPYALYFGDYGGLGVVFGLVSAAFGYFADQGFYWLFRQFSPAAGQVIEMSMQSGVAKPVNPSGGQ